MKKGRKKYLTTACLRRAAFGGPEKRNSFFGGRHDSSLTPISRLCTMDFLSLAGRPREASANLSRTAHGTHYGPVRSGLWSHFSRRGLTVLDRISKSHTQRTLFLAGYLPPVATTAHAVLSSNDLNLGGRRHLHPLRLQESSLCGNLAS